MFSCPRLGALVKSWHVEVLCVAQRPFAPILAEKGGFSDLHQMTSALGFKLLLRCLMMLQCQVLQGDIGEHAGRGYPSVRVQVREEGPPSACPCCKLPPLIRHRFAGCCDPSKFYLITSIDVIVGSRQSGLVRFYGLGQKYGTGRKLVTGVGVLTWNATTPSSIPVS
eukprot:313247-Pelagomonas_calceolata.AAC.6